MDRYVTYLSGTNSGRSDSPMRPGYYLIEREGPGCPWVPARRLSRSEAVQRAPMVVRSHERAREKEHAAHVELMARLRAEVA